MTIEALLVLFLTTITVLSLMVTKPRQVFHDATPKLGLRVEQQMTTGVSWTQKPEALEWIEPKN